MTVCSGLAHELLLTLVLSALYSTLPVADNFLILGSFRCNCLQWLFQGSPVFSNFFYLVTFYISYALLLIEMVLALFADRAARKPKHRQPSACGLEVEEQIPLSNGEVTFHPPEPSSRFAQTWDELVGQNLILVVSDRF